MAKIIYAKFVPFGAQHLCQLVNETGLADRVVAITPDIPPPGYQGPTATFVFFRVDDWQPDTLPK